MKLNLLKIALGFLLSTALSFNCYALVNRDLHFNSKNPEDKHAEESRRAHQFVSKATALIASLPGGTPYFEVADKVVTLAKEAGLRLDDASGVGALISIGAVDQTHVNVAEDFWSQVQNNEFDISQMTLAEVAVQNLKGTQVADAGGAAFALAAIVLIVFIFISMMQRAA